MWGLWRHGGRPRAGGGGLACPSGGLLVSSIVHQHDPNSLPDSEFEPGEPTHLVVGNTGRLLDPRRTPIRITGIQVERGQFELEILDFEDRGAHWVEVFENVRAYQFALGSERLEDPAPILAAIERFDRRVVVEAASLPAPDLTQLRGRAAPLVEGLSIDPGQGLPHEPAWAALQAFMEELELWDMEQAFATQFVSNPYSGELVKGHRLVLADLGLVAYEDKMLRDPSIFEGRWSRERRAEHLRARLAFVRQLFGQAGLDEVVLWRGLSTTGVLEPPRNRSFVSTSFSREVAESLFQGSEQTRLSVLWRQRIPLERLFMTYVETEAMNQAYRESEAVLLFDPDSLSF